MADVRSEEYAPVSTGRVVAVAAFVVSLHGWVLLVAWGAPIARNPGIAAAVLAATLVPWLAWVRGLGSPRRDALVALGLLPALWVAAAALFEMLGPPRATVWDAVRDAAGLLAHLGAAFEVATLRETRRRVETSPHVRSSPEATGRRQAVRTALLGSLTIPLAATVVATPFLAPGASRYERAFAAVAATVLASSLLLTVVPPLVRREKRPNVRTARRVAMAAAAWAVAAIALLIERATR